MVREAVESVTLIVLVESAVRVKLLTVSPLAEPVYCSVPLPSARALAALIAAMLSVQ
jgi:hypothetical protein